MRNVISSTRFKSAMYSTRSALHGSAAFHSCPPGSLSKSRDMSSDWSCDVPMNHRGSWLLDWTRQPLGLHTHPGAPECLRV